MWSRAGIWMTAVALGGFAACGGQPLPTAPGASSLSATSSCAVVVPQDQLTQSVDAGSRNLAIPVTTGADCAWTAKTSADFIVITAGTNGTGPGTVQVSVTANTGAERSGTITIGAVTVTIRQSAAPPDPTPPSPPAPPPACMLGVVPDSATLPASGGNVTITVSLTQGSGCAWSAVAHDSFITIAGASSGTDNGTVVLSVSGNTGDRRTGTVLIAGLTVTITQEAAPPPGCAFVVTPGEASVPAAGGSVTLTVTVTQGVACGWTATTSAAFLTVTSGGSGTGSEAVVVAVAPNIGSARTGTVVIAGRTVTVTQAAAAIVPCLFSVTPKYITLPVAGGTATFTVTVTQGTACAWTAAVIGGSEATGVTILSGASGVGNGTVVLSVAPNPGTQRGAGVTIAGELVAIHQPDNPGACVFAVSPTTINVSSAAQAATFTVTLTTGSELYCHFSVAELPTFARVTSIVPSSSGSRTVVLSIDENPGGARTTSLTAAGQTVVVNQAAAGSPPPPTPPPAACVYAVAPTSISLSPAAQSVSISVTTSPAACPWAVTSAASFITVVSAMSGNGAGTVSLSVTANSGSPRTGTLTIAGETVYVRQLSPLLAVWSFRSDAGDPIGQGQTRSYTIYEPQVSATIDISTYGTLNVTLTTADGRWFIRLAAPTGRSLAPGLYTNTAPAASASQAGLDVAVDGRKCGQSTGRFVIGDSSFSPPNRVHRFHVVFEQRCTGSSGLLTGDLWIAGEGTTVPPPLFLPAGLAGAGSLPADFADLTESN